MAKRIFEKAELIPGIHPGIRTAPTESGDVTRSKTAPGVMMGFLTVQSSAIKDAEALRAEVQSLKESSPLQRLDPTSVRPSKWANRHASAFGTAEFEALKLEIQAAGENVQPIKVRPVQPTEGPAPVRQEFEIIYGHRRHRACLELGLPVAAIVEQVDDVVLFQQMERENRGRKNLSAWEQGKMYGRALDEGLFPSQRKLAEMLGVDLALVSKSLSLARLPDEVVHAFTSPLDIQFRWAAGLAEAIQKDPEGVLTRAREVRAGGAQPKPTEIYESLIRIGADNGASAFSVSIQHAGKSAGLLRVDSTGRVQMSLKAGTLSPAKAKALATVVEEYLAR